MKNEILDPPESEGYAVWEEALSEYFKRKYEQWIEQGRIGGVRDMIFKNYRRRFGVSLSATLKDKTNAVDYYPALEERFITPLGNRLRRPRLNVKSIPSLSNTPKR